MRRREFLKTAGSFVATASAGGLWGCGDDAAERPDAGGRPDAGRPDAAVSGAGFAFDEGVASGDPRPNSVMLWTRVRARDGSDAKVALWLEVATDEAFEDRVLRQELEATAASDHTVRVLVEALEPDTIYYYRFGAGQDLSRVGRTLTAPAPGADARIHFAWVSCQDYSAGFFSAYRKLLNDDAERPADERLRFVLHVGDFIYETRGAGFQMALDDDLRPVMLEAADGTPRVVPPFPAGGALASGGTFAETLDDYRHLYRHFLHDPDLQAARAQWPFVCVWDDHEFCDDCWQTQANYTREDGADEPSQPRKLAANQAWFEYVPAILDEAEGEGGVDPRAHGFESAEVETVPYSDVGVVDEPNNAAAIASLTIYRRLRFGRHVELVLTDNRSYRSDHAVTEASTKDMILVFHPRAAIPLSAVNAFDAGREAPGLPESVAGIANMRRESPPGTVLGAAQKQWWKDTMRASGATFKVWGNSLPLVRIKLDVTDAPLFTDDLVLSADGWDGYPSERRELMAFLRDEGIRNVISLSGDHHAHFAGVVHDDYDAADPMPVMVDFSAAGIASSSQFAAIASQIEDVIGPLPLGPLLEVANLITYDSTPLGGTSKKVVNLNTLIRYGSSAAKVAAETNDLEQIEAARNPEVNPHLRYADTAANGYGLASIDGEGAQIVLVTIDRPLEDRGEEGAVQRGTAAFTVARNDGDDPPQLDEPELTGTRPFPLRD